MNDNWWAIASLVLSLAFTGLGWRLLASGRRFLYAHLWMACLFALQTGALCVKAYQTGMCPIRGASEVLFFLSWTINLFYLLLGRAYRMSVLGIFTAPAIAVLTALSLLIGLYGATLRQKLLLRGRELADATGRLHELAMRDALTGALNRRATMDLLDEALRAQSAGGPAVSVALVDLDHFKGINDRFGHPVGDEVLRRFVTAAVRATREADRVGRWGGEEFLVVLPACADARAAAAIAERVRESVATHPWGEIAPGLSVTASIGVAAARPGAGTAELLARADRALYRAKHDGRDRVHVDG